MRRHKDVTNRSVSFTYKLRRHVDVSARAVVKGVLRTVFNIRMEQNVSWSSWCICFRGFSYGKKSSWQSESVSCVSKILLKNRILFIWKQIVQAIRDFILINPRSQSYVFATSQVGPCLLGFTWYFLLTFQIGQSHLGSSWYIFATSRFGQPHLGTSWHVFSTSRIGHFHLGTRWYVFKRSQIG